MRVFPVVSLFLLTACAAPVQFLSKASMAPPPDAIGDVSARHQAAVRAALKRYYPALARRSEGGTQTVFFVSTTTGAIQRTDLIRGEAPVGSKPEALFWRFADLRYDPSLRASGVTVFERGEFGPDKLIVIWGERAAPVATRGPYRFAAAQESSAQR